MVGNMENNKESEEFNIEKTLRLPGVVAANYVVGTVAYLLGYYEFSFALMTAFSAPFIIIFIVESLLNKNLTLRQSIIGLFGFSYIFYMVGHYSVLLLEGGTAIWWDTIFHLHLTFLIGLATSLSIMLLYLSISKFFKTGSRRTLFFVAFLPATIIPSTIVYMLSKEMALAENTSIIDIWTLWHVLAGLAIGMILYNVIKDREDLRFEIGFSIPILFELVEQTIIANWFKIITPEFIGNSLVDIAISASAIFVGIQLAKKY